MIGARSLDENQRKALQELLLELEAETEFNWKYSGRGMNGRDCVGLVVHELRTNAQAVFSRFLMELAVMDANSCPEDHGLNYHEWASWREDVLGSSSIFYWEQFQVVEDL